MQQTIHPNSGFILSRDITLGNIYALCSGTWLEREPMIQREIKTLFLGLIAVALAPWLISFMPKPHAVSAGDEQAANAEEYLPIRGRDSKGKVYQGQSTWRASGLGDFWVENLDGVRCSGTYNSIDTTATIKANFVCSDERKGFAIISRASNLRQGIAIAKLDDGTTAELAFGDPAVWGNVPISFSNQ